MPAYFTLDGKRYEFATYDSLEIREIKEVQRISGQSHGRILQDLLENNASAEVWVGLFVVSMRRAGSDVTEDDLEDVNLTEAINQLQTVSEEADPAPNPPIKQPSGPGASGNANTDLEKTQEIAGIPAGSPTSG